MAPNGATCAAKASPSLWSTPNPIILSSFLVVSDDKSRDHSLDEMPDTGDGRAELLGISVSASSSTTSPHKGVDPYDPAHIYTDDQDLYIMAAVCEKPFRSAKDVRGALGLGNLSDSTVRRRLRNVRLRSRTAAQKPLLTAANKQLA
ncbi:hypothetical protein HPB50_005197 [Hyalomma asiaticum]|uniref:Uncharacterized protein n=1 Tax=Hyalomma asiaticum TaxID=266040 RepID=A0ACB7S7I7_HYAAI|nr:hypothetical protein HPB50_005197 [Hyalomma asiaticum]